MNLLDRISSLFYNFNDKFTDKLELENEENK